MTEIMVLFASLSDKPEANALAAIEQGKAYHRLTPAQKLELGYRSYY